MAEVMAAGAMAVNHQHFTRSESGQIIPRGPLDLAVGKKSWKQDYEVSDKDVLGQGMSGSVVTAVHRQTGQKVAVKSFNLDKLSRRQRMDLNREIKIQSSMHHPGIARLHELYTSEQHARLVLEHLEGGDLVDDLKQRGPRKESEAALIIKQVLQAVEHIHNQGVVHRDIKIDNLVFESKDRDKVKLIDFGLSVFWREGMTPLKRYCGTPGYMAPEVEEGYYTSKADLWSVGIVAYNMLTAERCVMDAVSCPVFPAKFKCSPDAKNFITALLAADPALRLSASEALKHSWIQNADSSRVQLHSSRFSTRDSEPTELADPVNTALAPRTTGDDAVQVKKSVWKKLFPARFLKSSKASALWAAVSRRRTAPRVAPEMQIVPCHSG